MNRADCFVSSDEFPSGSIMEKSILEDRIDFEIHNQVVFLESFFNNQIESNDEILKSEGVIYLSAKNSNTAFPFRVQNDRLSLVLTNELKLELKLSAIIRKIEEGRE